MGNPKQKWTPEEEEALRAGIAKYGTGKWKNIKLDPEFNQYLHSRTNIDLKDKWRNISAAAGQGSRTLKARSSQDSAVTPVLNGQTSVPALPDVHHSPRIVKDDESKELPDAKNGSRYNAMVIEALSTAKESNGLGISSLVSFIEQRVEVPQNFRKLLGSRLRRLVAREKLEKIENCYRIKDKCLSEPHQTMLEDIRPRQSQSIINSPCESLEADAAFAAMSLAKAEDLSFEAAEAVRETERVTKMVEEAAQALQLANEIFERCSRGEVVPIA